MGGIRGSWAWETVTSSCGHKTGLRVFLSGFKGVGPKGKQQIAAVQSKPCPDCTAVKH